MDKCNCNHYTITVNGICKCCGKPIKTLGEVRKNHNAHTDFVWSCKHCKFDYARAIEQKTEEIKA